MLEQASLVLALILQAEAGTAYPFESAGSCAKCHSAIYSEWRNTMHAQSYTDPVFQVAYHQVAAKADRRVCLECHAPLARYAEDPELDHAITREGITCDFCHTVSGLSGDTPSGLYVVEPGHVKRGPFEEDELTEKGHKNEYSSLHLKAEFCGGCHEVVNAQGFHVMSTYTEWKDGPYPASGTQCQNCHMPEDIRFPIVDAEVVPSTKMATSHGFMGGHSRIQVQNAADITLFAERSDREINALIYVTNKESGHSLPTGLPSRRLVLTVRLRERDRLHVLGERTKEYRRVLADAEGREIDGDDVVRQLLHSAAVLRDNRPAPKKTIREAFHFEAPDTPSALVVEAVLEYDLKPGPVGRGPTRIEMARAEFPLDEPSRNHLGKTIWIPVVVLISAWALVYLFRRTSARGRVEPKGKNG